MPKFDDYTQKTTPEDTDITLILDKTANVNKKTPFSGIWTWIVNKMTNAVIQNLQTTNKTVIGSINELNSKILFGENMRYVKVVSDNKSLNWGGIFLVTKLEINLISINGLSAPEIVWSSISPAKATVNNEANPLETIIDTNNPKSHILAIPVGSISKSKIKITNYI